MLSELLGQEPDLPDESLDLGGRHSHQVHDGGPGIIHREEKRFGKVFIHRHQVVPFQRIELAALFLVIVR